MKLKNLLLLLLLAALWGPSFLFIKVAVAEIPPFTLVVGRVSIAAVVLYVLLRLQGGKLPPPGRVWFFIAVVALFHNSFPFVLLGWAEQRIDSALASILNGLTPIFTIMLAHLLTADDRLTPKKVGGVALGLLGTVFLVFPSLQSGLQASTVGMLAVIVVSASYGFALVYTSKHLSDQPSIVAPTGQMIMATAYLVPLMFLIDQPFSLPRPSLQAIGSVVALGFLGTAMAFTVYYRLLRSAAASYVSMVTYLIPIVGVLLGVVILNEQLGWYDYAGFALILIGVVIINN